MFLRRTGTFAAFAITIYLLAGAAQAATVLPCSQCHYGSNIMDFHHYNVAPTLPSCETCHAPATGGQVDCMNLSCHGSSITGAHTECLSCHSSPMVNRRSIGLDFLSASRHIQTAPTSADCLVCHLLTSHMQGTVLLKSPEDGSAISYTSEASANAFCLGCHDDNHKATIPFSDGRTPTSSTWNWDGKNIAVKYNTTEFVSSNKYPPTAAAPKMGAPYNTVPDVPRALSAHGNPARNLANGDTADRPVPCLACHNSHGSTKAPLLFSTSSYQPASMEDFCWDCHTNDPTSPQKASLYIPYNWVRDYFGDPRWGLNNGAGFKTNWMGSFAYKNSVFMSSHFYPSKTNRRSTLRDGVTPLTCTDCHDPHGVDPGLTATKAYMVPLLKGTWMISPYKEDRAPLSSYASALLDTPTTRYADGHAPRGNPDLAFNNTRNPGGGYANGTGGAGHEGYFIDDNTFGLYNPLTSSPPVSGSWKSVLTAGQTLQVNRIAETDVQFAGLCLRCHTQAALKTAWPGHGTVKGWGGATRDLFPNRLATSGGEEGPGSGMHAMGKYASSQSEGGGKYGRGYRWGVNPQTEKTSGYIQADYHQFTCSKCHSPHATNMPRLLVTNCLDSKGGHTSYAKSISAQATNCHSTQRSLAWNTLTPWIETDIPPTYTIMATCSSLGGTILPAGDNLVPSGNSLTITITPYSGYAISSVLVDGVTQGAISSYTFSNVTANHAIHAIFALAPTVSTADPVFSPGPGSYPLNQIVRITSETSGARIAYTTDGSTPSRTNGVQAASGATVTLTGSMTLKALAYLPAGTDSAVVSGVYSLALLPAAAPVFTPGAYGVFYTTPQTITVATSTAGASIRYTTNGTIPTRVIGTAIPSGGSVSIDRNMTLLAVAYKDAMLNSPVTSGIYTLNAAVPVLSVLGGTYLAPQSVTITSATPGAQIRYTVDGTTQPTPTVGTLLSNGVTLLVDRSMTLKVVSYRDGWTPSSVISQLYTFKAATPALAPLGGAFAKSQNVTITSPTPGALIRYTTDGTTMPTPTVGTALSNGGTVVVNRTLTLKAIAYRDGWTPASVVSAAYTLNAVAPVLAPTGGSFLAPQSVTITTATVGGLISYTTDGSTPSQTNGIFVASGAAVPVDRSLTLRAVAFKPGWTDTTVAAGIYSFKATLPVLSTPGGAYTDTQNVTITSTTPGASIRYTTDGVTLPTDTVGTLLANGGTVVVNRSLTLKAIARRDGWTPTTAVSATYSFKAATPALAPLGTTYYQPQSVTITSATNGASISYTTDGSTPSQTNGTVISSGAAVPVDRSLTLKAIAFKPGWTDTIVVSGTYTFKATLPVLAPLGGAYTDAQNVTITSVTSGASIRYTTDGVTLPTATVGTVLVNGGTVVVNRSLTLKAIACRDGWTPTSTVSATYSFKAATPTLAPLGTTYYQPQNVTITSATTGVSISYTTDGSTPSQTNGTVIPSGTAVPVDRSLSLKAIAFKPGWTDTTVVSGTYTFKATLPVLAPLGGAYTDAQNATITSVTSGASIRYTTDGVTLPTPTVGTVLANGGAVVVNRSLTLKAIAYRDGWTETTAVSATYSFKAATPTLAPIGTTYYQPQSVTITTTTTGGSISYTTDGSTPTQTNGTVISSGAAVLVNRSLSLKAIAFKPGWTDTTVVSGTYTFKATLPVFSQLGGTFTDAQNVTITSITPGASISYTTDGVTLPTPAVGTVIPNGGTVAVNRSLTLKAIAFRAGWTPTTAVSATYTLKAATPTLAPLGTTYYQPQSVTITSATIGASISYTTDGSTPSQTNGKVISSGAAVPVDRSLSLKAVAFKPGWTDTTAVSGTYTFRATLPVLSRLGGTYADAQNVTITSVTPGASISYTTDGVTLPTDTVGTVLPNGGTVAVNRSLTLKAIAFRAGWTPTTAISATYTLKAATPTLSPLGTTYYQPQSVTITTATTGGLISYTTDGSIPSQANGTQIASGGTVTVDRSLSLKAVAFKPGWTDTTAVSGTYTFRATLPVFSPRGGTYPAAQNVTITSVTPGASIRYTTDGTTMPTDTVGTLLANGGTVLVDRTMVLRAVAFRDGWTPTAAASATYTIKTTTAALGTQTSH